MALSLRGRVKESNFILSKYSLTGARNFREQETLFHLEQEEDLTARRHKKSDRSLREENTLSIHTESPPITSNNTQKLPGSRSCTLWVHLQASITTEWEQRSILITPAHKTGAKLISSKSFFEGHHRKGKLLEDMNRQKKLPIPNSIRDNDLNPKTVHRCILKCVDKAKEPKSHDLECHVCHWKYSTYDKYFRHLIELDCSRQNSLSDHKRRRSRSSLESHRYIPSDICQRKVRRLSPGKPSPPGVYEQETLRMSSEHVPQDVLPTPMHEEEDEDHGDKEEAPLNLTSKKRIWLLKEGSQDPVLGSNILDDRESLMQDNKEVVRKLTDELQRTIVFCPETIDDTVYCPHWAARFLPALSVNDNVKDEISLSNLRAQITKLLLLVFGENKLTMELGYPVKDVVEILETVSIMYGRIGLIHTDWETCRSECHWQTEKKISSYFVTQLKYRFLKRKINTTKKNLLKFVESLPHFYDLS